MVNEMHEVLDSLIIMTALKHKHMASKFNPGVKMMKKSQGNNYLFKKQLLRTNFSGCARITKCAQ